MSDELAERRRVSNGGRDVLAEQVEEVLHLLRQAVAEMELARKNVNSFVREAESLVRGLGDLAEH